MANNSLVTSVTHSNADVLVGKQKPYWVEVQLVDELGNAVANIPWKAESHHPNEGRIKQLTYSGVSDAEGLIRIDMPHGLEMRLFLEADPLAKEMEKRSLRVGRDAEADSTVRLVALGKGYKWHYATIGELCRAVPSAYDLRKGEVWPIFHFPLNTRFKGFTIRTNELEVRHVLEICPFRAWELVLHHQKDYSIANALNLGVAATLAYADDNALDTVSITQFFINQCQDLSRLPQLHKDGSSWNVLAQDVPFNERYYPPVFMDTSRETLVEVKKNKDEPLSDKNQTKVIKPDGDTQLFYVYNTDEIIVSWRGTASRFDAGTDLAFRPVKTEFCDENKTQCSSLLTSGKVHTGFWSGYNRVESKFKKEIEILSDLTETLDLFICGHSLGGALALIHSVVLKSRSPLLYTYGMPRTFTKEAISQLSDITHFRHVNDSDPVPAVPPEANLDNELYRIWGPLGGTLGFFWSLGELITYQMISWGDCFWHHGNPVVFLTTEQSREWGECKINLPNPAGCISIRRLLPLKTKIYLVPSLAEQEMQDAGKNQKEFIESLTKVDLREYFPKGGNPERGANIKVYEHFMTSYMPFINNKLLELIDKSGITERRTFVEHSYNVDLFKKQMKENVNEIPVKEYVRNEILLNIEGLLDVSLSPMLSLSSGINSLVRYANYGGEVIEYV
ncbi:lipase family protein [Pantoea sp. PNT02]|uniref:lipase family protein n=1 Tax=Pantoea sp. PNT02 TaxID=2769261 RepID=UPI00177EE9A0|nr:lipase family protein [Pantoea sp. PNT02]MBD9642632.1 lipase family protein [Pantoea sp. PNT02]